MTNGRGPKGSCCAPLGFCGRPCDVARCVAEDSPYDAKLTSIRSASRPVPGADNPSLVRSLCPTAASPGQARSAMSITSHPADAASPALGSTFPSVAETSRWQRGSRPWREGSEPRRPKRSDVARPGFRSPRQQPPQPRSPHWRAVPAGPYQSLEAPHNLVFAPSAAIPLPNDPDNDLAPRRREPAVVPGRWPKTRWESGPIGLSPMIAVDHERRLRTSANQIRPL